MTPGAVATTQALRRLGHTISCIAAARRVTGRSVWASVKRPEVSGRRPWHARTQAERDAALAAAWDLLSQHECRCSRPPDIPGSTARRG
jgi:hypothetical protein